MAVSHSPGLLLLGFFREPQALAILNSLCVCPDTRRDALKAICLEARKSRGGAIAKAGAPGIRDIPPELKAYAAQVAALDRLRGGVAGLAFEPKMVEIRRLMAIQAGVFLDRVAEIETTLGASPTSQVLAEVCLPLDAKLDANAVTVDVSKLPMTLLTRNPNVSVLAWAVANQDPASGLLPLVFFVGQREPCIQVIEYNGNYFLRNGYHRAVAAMRRGGRPGTIAPASRHAARSTVPALAKEADEGTAPGKAIDAGASWNDKGLPAGTGKSIHGNELSRSFRVPARGERNVERSHSTCVPMRW